MSDSFSFTEAEMAGATAAGFADPRQQAETTRINSLRSSDALEYGILTGAITAAEVPEEIRRQRSQVETMFSGNKLTPWHRLPEAKVLDGTLGSLEALEASGLNWTVLKKPLQIIDEAFRTEQKVPSFALVRDTDKKVLSACGNGYTVVQNATLFAIAEALVKTGAKWETAGSLDGGKRVWVLLSLKDSGFPVEGDEVKPYLLISNAHGDAKTVEIALTTIRTVCNNSYRLAISSAGSGCFRFKHTANVEVKLAQAGEILLKANERFAEFTAHSKKLADLKLGEQEQIDYLVKALGIDADPEERTAQMRKKLETAKLCLAAEKAAAQPGYEDSAWTAFNAVTRFTSHETRVNRTGGDPGRAAEKRLERATWGPNADLAANAFEMVMERTMAAAAN